MTRILKLDDSYKFLVTENKFTNKITFMRHFRESEIELKGVENNIFGILWR